MKEPQKIKSFWILYDEEEECYSVEIDNGSRSVIYPRTNIVFSNAVDGIMAFPVSVTIMDEQKKVIDEYSLTAIQKPDSTIKKNPNQEQK